MTVILNLTFRREGDKNFKFCFENQGGGMEGGTCEVLQPCHPPKFGMCTYLIAMVTWLSWQPK